MPNRWTPDNRNYIFKYGYGEVSEWLMVPLSKSGLRF